MTVVGTSWQGQAAQVLAHEAGLRADTAARLLLRLEAGRVALPRGSVLVVDEAGMMPTRPLERLVAHVVAAGGVAVLVGDRDQLPAIDAGGAFAGLAERLGRRRSPRTDASAIRCSERWRGTCGRGEPRGRFRSWPTPGGYTRSGTGLRPGRRSSLPGPSAPSRILSAA